MLIVLFSVEVVDDLVVVLPKIVFIKFRIIKYAFMQWICEVLELEEVIELVAEDLLEVLVDVAVTSLE